MNTIYFQASSLSDVKTATPKVNQKPRSVSTSNTPDKGGATELRQQRKHKADVKRIKVGLIA